MSKIDSIEYYKLVSEEIGRHLEDSEVSKLAHFYAAAKYESIHRYWLGLPATLAAIILAWIVSKDVGMPDAATTTVSPWYSWSKTTLSLAVPLLTGLSTFLNLNDTASKHRNAAQRYHQLWRKCKNWRTDFPDDTSNDEAKKIAVVYRVEINDINNDSPQIPRWAWKSTQKQQSEGSTEYNKH